MKVNKQHSIMQGWCLANHMLLVDRLSRSVNNAYKSYNYIAACRPRLVDRIQVGAARRIPPFEKN